MKNINLAQPKNKEITVENRFNRYFEKEPELAFITKLQKELPELKLYLVGGIVRDTLIKHPMPGTEKHKIKSKDFDFVACGVTIDTIIQKLKTLGKVDLVGKNFGVLKFYPRGVEVEEAIDIALPRTEIATGTGGYRDVEAQADPSLPVEDDLSRRDLTINAIAWDMKNQKLVDPFDGKKDLQKGIIRAVGKPEERFQEDYSRMLRTIRFACRFDFKIEEKTWKAMQKLMPHINDMQGKERIVPMETISKEILKALAANPAKALELLDRSGGLKEILPEVFELKNCEQPEIFHSEGNVFEHVKLMLQNLDSPEFKKQFPKAKISGDFVLAVLLHDIGKPATQKFEGEKISFYGHHAEGEKIAEAICKRLRLTGEQTKKIKFLVRKHMLGVSQDLPSNNKIAQNFLDNPAGNELLMLLYLDIVSSLKPDGSSDLSGFTKLKKKIAEIKKIRENQPARIEEIINGQMIMQILPELKKGPIIGIIKSVVAELKEQGKINNQDEAKKFLLANKDVFLELNKQKLPNKPKEIDTIISQTLQEVKT